MTTTLAPDFLRAVVLMTGFKPHRMRRVQAALLYCALETDRFTAAVLPAEVTRRDDGSPDRHIAGAATGALIVIGLLTAVGRVKSPVKESKGRKLDLLTAANVANIRAWLRANGYADHINTEPQRELFHNSQLPSPNSHLQPACA